MTLLRKKPSTLHLNGSEREGTQPPFLSLHLLKPHLLVSIISSGTGRQTGAPSRQPLTFLSSLSTSAACSVFFSRRSLWISRIHATRLTYGLWLVLRSIPGSLSDLSIREVNNKSLPPFSLSGGLSFLGRLLLDSLLSKSRLLCLLNLEPIIPGEDASVAAATAAAEAAAVMGLSPRAARTSHSTCNEPSRNCRQ